MTFEINADGIVSVHARDIETGVEQSITVTATSGLTHEEVQTMMEDAQQYAVARRNDEAAEKAKQEAETLIAEIEALFPKLQRVIVTIRTTDGAEYTKQLDYPKGDPRNPLTDAEVEEKFDALAAPVLSEGARTSLKQAVWELERQDSISDLMARCTSDV